MSLKNVLKELGPCPAVNHHGTIDSYFYGPNRIELEVKIDTNTQRVVGLAVDRYFTGATEDGVAIGTPVAKVLAAYGDRAPAGRQSVLREGGVWFGFDTAGNVDRIWLQETP